MKDELRSKLDETFAQHEEFKRKMAEAAQRARDESEEFLKEFLEVRASIIKPALIEIGEYVLSRGYSYEITEEEDKKAIDRNTPGKPASIRLTIFVGPRSYDIYQHPGFTAQCEKGGKSVHFHENTVSPGRGGHTGSAGQAKLGEITKDLIQEKVLKIISEIFR